MKIILENLPVIVSAVALLISLTRSASLTTVLKKLLKLLTTSKPLEPDNQTLQELCDKLTQLTKNLAQTQHPVVIAAQKKEASKHE